MESDGIITCSCSYLRLVLPLSTKKVGTRKSDEKIFVDRPFFNRKHQENEHLEPFPSKMCHNDNLCMLPHYLSNLHHLGQSFDR